MWTHGANDAGWRRARFSMYSDFGGSLVNGTAIASTGIGGGRQSLNVRQFLARWALSVHSGPLVVPES
jgi:hypothetical protein